MHAWQLVHWLINIRTLRTCAQVCLGMMFLHIRILGSSRIAIGQDVGELYFLASQDKTLNKTEQKPRL